MRKYAKLRALMTEHGDTAKQLTRALLLDASTVSRKLCGHTPWTCDEMWILMDRYGVPAGQMAIVFPKNGERVI